MDTSAAANAVERAAAYYDSPDADEFYFRVWGGEDIHIGLYDKASDTIGEAGRRTVERMLRHLEGLPSGAHLLDIGSGYGGSARHIARAKGWRVTCLNLSVVQNERNREMNREAGLDDLIEVVDGNFEALPFPDGVFDAVWSQDAILHSADRPRVLGEVDRVLRAGGRFIFTDPMQADHARTGDLRPVLDRIHLDSLGSFAFYRQQGERLGWVERAMEDLSEHLTEHYTRVKAELIRRDTELDAFCSRAYRERMQRGLQHWIDAGGRGDLAWGILDFAK